MIHYTVLIPQRDATDRVRELLPQLGLVFGNLILPYEIICIDDASTVGLEALLDDYAHLRVLRFDEPRGTSAALTAGIAAARGDLIVAVGPDTRLKPQVIPQMIARLSRHDLIVAEQETTLIHELRQRLSTLSRCLVGESHIHASEDLLWAARRDAVSGLTLARGAFRMLPALVARRGMRVGRLSFPEGLPPQGIEFRANFVERLATRWVDRRFEPHLACELARGDAAHPRLKLARAEVGRTRVVPQPGFVPAEKEHRDSA